MVNQLNSYEKRLGGIELNFSCPNVKNEINRKIPESKHDIYLKLNWTQDPRYYDMDKVRRIHVNLLGLPFNIGALSGKLAQEKNWAFINEWLRAGYDVAGASWTSLDDIKRLEDMGCTWCGIGSQILTMPFLVQKLKQDMVL